MYKAIIFANVVLCSNATIKNEKPQLVNDPETPYLEVSDPTDIHETLTYDDF